MWLHSIKLMHNKIPKHCLYYNATSPYKLQWIHIHIQIQIQIHIQIQIQIQCYIQIQIQIQIQLCY